MNDTFTDWNCRYYADGFCAGKIAFLQPPLKLADLTSGVMITEDPFYLSCINNVLRVWSQSRHDMPYSFAEEVKVVSASRQAIALYTVELQHLRRRAVAVRSPYDGGVLNTSEWSTNDLFKLVPVSTAQFPQDVVEESAPLLGREIVEGCQECGETGQVLCTSCGGVGRSICTACGGASQVVCPQCQGGGTHIGVRGSMIQCRRCNTRGTVSCGNCNNGQVTCRQCFNGSIRCSTCNGHGHVKTSWELHSTTNTRTYRSHNMHEDWPTDLKWLWDDSEEIYSHTWDWPLEATLEVSDAADAPVEVLFQIRDLLETSLKDTPPSDLGDERTTAARVRVNGTYAYMINYSYREAQGCIYLAGATNRVVTTREAIRRPSLVKRLATLGIKLFDAVMGNEGPPVDSTYLHSLRAGKVHIADTRCLMSLVANILRVTLTVTEEGYTLRMPPNDSKFEIEVRNDEYKVPILCVAHVIGPARRDRFSHALVTGHSLSFGRIALVDEPGTGKQTFEYVERRPYHLVEPHHVARLLQAMAVEADSIRRQKVLA